MFDLLKYAIAEEATFMESIPEYDSNDRQYQKLLSAFERSNYYKKLVEVGKRIIAKCKNKKFDGCEFCNFSISLDYTGKVMHTAVLEMERSNDSAKSKELAVKEITKFYNIAKIDQIKKEFDPIVKKIHPKCHISACALDDYDDGVEYAKYLSIVIKFDIGWVKSELSSDISGDVSDADFIKAVKLAKDTYKIIYNKLPKELQKYVVFEGSDIQSGVQRTSQHSYAEAFYINCYNFDDYAYENSNQYKTREFRESVNRGIQKINKDLVGHWEGDEQWFFVIAER